MQTSPSFFVPNATPDNQESIYAEHARLCRLAIPPAAERIFAIEFESKGETWRAQVGMTLRGTKHTRKRVKGKTVEQVQHLSDPALVLAIFAGSPYQVVTNQCRPLDVGSQWVNPLLAGVPRSVTLFSPSA
jgi:hypothetical protein